MYLLKMLQRVKVHYNMMLRTMLSIALLLLTGCAQIQTILDDVQPPSKQVTLAEVKNAWWQRFNDPLIDALVPRLLAQNIDLKIAAARIDESRGISRIAGSALLPEISMSSDASRANTQVFLDKPITTKQAGFDALWELDLFGRNRANVRAAESRITSQMASHEDVRNSLIAELIRAAIEWRKAQQTIRETNALLASQQEQISLLKSRSSAGLIEQSSLERAKAQRAQTTVQLPLAKAAMRRAQYQIERLLDEKPDALKELFASQSELSLSLPSLTYEGALAIEHIRKRPDLRAAHAEMIAAQADLQKAEADLWPRITLAGFFGVRDLPSGVPAADNPIWSLATSLSAPLLNFGRLRGAVDVANARAKQASLAYENAVGDALEEIRTALSDYAGTLAALRQQKRVQSHRDEALKLAQARFASGLTDMSDVTTAQAELEQASLDVISREAEAAIAYVKVQKALGTNAFSEKLQPLKNTKNAPAESAN